MKKNLLIAGLGAALAIIAIFLIFRVVAKPTPSGVVSSQKEEKAPEPSVQDDDRAIQNLQAAITKDPGSAQAESSLFKIAAIYEKRNDPLKARESYQKIIESFPASGDIQKAQEALDNLNIKILFSPMPTADSFTYEVQKGNTLGKIAKKFGTTIGLISRSNNLKDTKIRIGERLKITKMKFSIVVDKSQNILTLKADGSIIKTYLVSTGKDFSTPAGTFKITSKLVNPVWYSTNAVIPPDSPENILGSRWLGISVPGYGIHGTTEPQSIGKQVTAGCVRMKNSDVEELYDIVPEGIEVVIVD